MKWDPMRTPNDHMSGFKKTVKSSEKHWKTLLKTFYYLITIFKAWPSYTFTTRFHRNDVSKEPETECTPEEPGN